MLLADVLFQHAPPRPLSCTAAELCAGAERSWLCWCQERSTCVARRALCWVRVVKVSAVRAEQANICNKASFKEGFGDVQRRTWGKRGSDCAGTVPIAPPCLRLCRQFVHLHHEPGPVKQCPWAMVKLCDAVQPALAGAVPSNLVPLKWASQW